MDLYSDAVSNGNRGTGHVRRANAACSAVQDQSGPTQPSTASRRPTNASTSEIIVA